ncbi:hypothetical protein OHB04_19235 [Streptomyces sp. NBC_01775]|uniref:hypothetical protein n=1 Tax=Streptomyces sp. NBC_01775 TaxID=2975939 RepID=UPI002DD9B669|nr:hypothetical protein [Streptomyces sp. NBC_01775]WSB77702.1 hypothetical protein OHB04_19235 [Streptomyces sp. NBC_01775]
MDSLSKVLGLRNMAESPGQPRARAIQHIQGVLRDNNVPSDQTTVGDAIVASISTIQLAAGERGAEDVDRCFRSEALKNAYLTPINSPYAREAHEFIASRESAFWADKARTNPTQGNLDAASFTVAQRVQFQEAFGRINDVTRENLRHYQQQQTFAQYSNAPFSSNSRGQGSYQAPSEHGHHSSSHRHHSSSHHHSSKSGQGNGQGSGHRRSGGGGVK